MEAVCEALAPCLERRGQLYWNIKPLFAALTSILREADQLDDEPFMVQAIALQDRFLKLSLAGMDEMLAQAERA